MEAAFYCVLVIASIFFINLFTAIPAKNKQLDIAENALQVDKRVYANYILRKSAWKKERIIATLVVAIGCLIIYNFL